MLQGVPIGIHMQIALGMTDGGGGREELLLTWQGPAYPENKHSIRIIHI